ncbi:MAG: hypothetical protein NC548_00480 [Lachnospiraceae bacterium]|nr:hypothetical protein [Lachnospiraceae bacterium]
MTKRVRVSDALQRTFRSSGRPPAGRKRLIAERNGAGKRGRWLPSSAPSQEYYPGKAATGSACYSGQGLRREMAMNPMRSAL